MSGDAPDRPPTAALLEELSVKRNTAIGLAVGIAVAALLYAIRVFELLGPAPGTREYPILGVEGWFLLLAVVLAVALTLLVAIGLTVITAIRSTKDLPRRS